MVGCQRVFCGIHIMDDANSLQSATVRDSAGRFAAGNQGRPRGSKNRFAADAMRQIKEMTPDAMAGLQSNIAAGNMDAIRFVLERVVGKGRTIELDGDKPTDISTALMNGELTTDEAAAIATVLEKLARVEELDAVLNRMSEIERLLKG